MKVIKHNARILDKITFLAGFGIPLITIPQLYTIWVSNDTDGVSVITWGLYCVVSMIFAGYGIVHREKLLVFTYTPLVFIEALIVTGLLVQG